MTRSILALLATATVATVTHAQPPAVLEPPAAIGFVVLAGADTLAAERVTRTASHVRGELFFCTSSGCQEP